MADLPVKHAGNPLKTNSQLNREAAQQCYAAGMTPQQIADEWPEVWTMTAAGLSQRYDYALADGRHETDRRITSASVNAAIKRYQRKGEADAAG